MTEDESTNVCVGDVVMMTKRNCKEETWTSMETVLLGSSGDKRYESWHHCDEIWHGMVMIMLGMLHYRLNVIYCAMLCKRLNMMRYDVLIHT